jgi:hypothetical protein
MRPASFASYVAMTAFVLAFSALAETATPGSEASLMKPDAQSAVISFVRRHILYGDGNDFDVWHRDTFIEPLGAGRLVQYRVAPGEHVFMVRGRGGQSWTFLRANVAAGKEYFVRAYPMPFHVRGIDGRADLRIEEWHQMEVDAPLKAKSRDKYVAATIEEARAALKAFESGSLPPECALWKPPFFPSGKKRKPVKNEPSICQPAGELVPELGI